MLRHMDLIGEAGTTLPMHAHDWGQLLLVAEGAVSIETGSGQWLIAPSRTVWVPPRVQHRLAIPRRATLRFLYLSPLCCAELPVTSRLIKVSALLRELMSEAIRRAPLDHNPRSSLLCGLLVDQTKDCAIETIELLMPIDPRARTVAQRIQDPACLAQPLEHLMADSGASRRTIERLFAEETGISLARWRQRWRMNVAAAQLLSGLAVIEVAEVLGYGSVSSFSAAFREQHGTTPAKFGR
jgi:AraC-like DNA-binding protein